MKKEKLSLNSIKNVLTRAEMKKIMAGSGPCNGGCGPGCADTICACFGQINPVCVGGF